MICDFQAVVLILFFICLIKEQPKLDDDEDRQNPAYIPRRGAFYEHDMRLDPNDEVKETGDQAREEKR